ALVCHADRGCEPAGVVVALGAGTLEVGPEVELEEELRGVAAEERSLEEDGRLGVLGSLVVREPEVRRVPRRLAGDRFADVRVDLRQRMVARDAPEGVRQRRV